MDLFEINEAFLFPSVSSEYGIKHSRRKAKCKWWKLYALGHPVGASGARIMVTLLHELKQRGLKRGAGSLCIGGGQGAAAIIEII